MGLSSSSSRTHSMAEHVDEEEVDEAVLKDKKFEARAGTWMASVLSNCSSTTA